MQRAPTYLNVADLNKERNHFQKCFLLFTYTSKGMFCDTSGDGKTNLFKIYVHASINYFYLFRI